MENSEIACTFNRIADLMEIKGENRYKVLAYRRAAELIPTFPQRLDQLTPKELDALPGIGQALAEKIQELNSTGKLVFLEKLEREVPPSLIEVLAVPHVGPKKAALFWRQAGVTTLAELEEAARAGKLRALPGMGEKSEARILAGIESLRSAKKRLPIHAVLPLAEEWLARLLASPAFQRLAIAGSLRRMRPSIGDLDLVGSTDSYRAAMDFFLSRPGIQEVVSRGEYKSSVRLADGLNMQLWLQPDERFGSLLQFVTGSKAHNVHLREFALKQGLSLSERGFISQDLRETLCAEEEDVYRLLGLPFIAPELREDHGEIEAAEKGELPHLCSNEDLIADLHLDGSGWREKGYLDRMSTAARQSGLQTICFVSSLPAGAPLPDRQECSEFVHRIAQERATQHGRIRVLCGLEINCATDSALPSDVEIFSSFDLVSACLTCSGGRSSRELTALALKMLEHPRIRILSCRASDENSAAEISQMDWDSILKAAGSRGVALEVSARDLLLGPDEAVLKLAAKHGVPLSLTSRADTPTQLADVRYSLGISRRAWLPRENILSARHPEKLIAWLKPS